MADALIDSSEEYFLANKLQSASDFASLTAALDPFFGSIQHYAAAFAVHAATLKKTASGETDWYEFDIHSGLMKAPETKVMKKVVASSTTEKTEPKQHSHFAMASSRDTNKVEIRSCLTAASRALRVHPRFRHKPSIC